MGRYFQVSFHALILTAFLALTATGRLAAPTVVLFLAAFAGLAYRNLRGRPPLLGPRGSFACSTAYIVFFGFDAVMLSGSFIEAALHLVLFLELVKLAEEKTDRDYLYLMILPFLQVLAAASLTIDMSFLAVLLLFLVALVSTLISFDIHRAERRSGETAAAPMALALGGVSLWATLWIVILGSAFFFAIPRFGTGYFSRAATEGLLLSGFSESVQLGELGDVKLSSALVMRTRVLEGGLAQIPKWRGVVLESFDGYRWSNPERERELVLNRGDDRFMLTPPETTDAPVRFEVFLEPLATPTLFGARHVREIRGDFRMLERDRGDAVFQRMPTGRRLRYEVVSQPPPLDRSAVPAAAPPPLETAEMERYLQLPPGLDPRILELAESVAAAGETAFEQALLTEGHLKRSYAYTLDLSWDPGPQPLATFLFDARRGHCEYFASSMAIMLRAIGIPTRIVNGFLPGEFNSVGDSYIVRQSDAHSWVEAYLPEQGWVEFDPTPPDPNLGEVTLAVLAAHYLDAARLFWNSYLLIYDSGAQIQLFRNAQQGAQNLQVRLRAEMNAWTLRLHAFADEFRRRLDASIQRVSFWLTLLLFAAAGLALQHRRRLRTRFKLWRLRAGAGTADADVVAELFHRAANLAGGRRLRRHPHQTWREWIALAPDPRRRDLASQALEIFEKSRYGAQPLTPEEVARLRHAIAELKAMSSRRHQMPA